MCDSTKIFVAHNSFHIFQHFFFDGLIHLLVLINKFIDVLIMVSKNCLVSDEQPMASFLVQNVTIATVHSIKNTFNLSFVGL